MNVCGVPHWQQQSWTSISQSVQAGKARQKDFEFQVQMDCSGGGDSKTVGGGMNGGEKKGKLPG